MKKVILTTWALLSLVLGAGSGCSADNQAVTESTLPDGAASTAPGSQAPARLFGGGYPTGGANATSIQGVPVGPLGATGSVLTVGSGPSLEWDVPAAGVMLSSTTPAGVGTAAGAVGVGTTAARADHVHLLPVVPLSLGGFGQSLAGLLTTPTELGYLHNVIGPIQSQIDLLLPTSSAKLPPTPTAANKLLYDTGAAYAETAACSSASTVLVGGSPPACAAVPDAALSANIVTLTGAQILTNKTLNCANNTCTVRLGSDVTGITPVANGGTNSSTALTGNQVLVSSGGKIVEAGTCSTSQVLVGGSPPACAGVPDAALSANVVTLTGSQTLTNKTVTAPAISSPALSGTSTGAGLIAKANGGFGQSVATGLTFGDGVYVDSAGVLQIGKVPFNFNLSFYGGTTTNEYALIQGNAVSPQLSAIGIPLFSATSAGTCFLMTAQSDTPTSGTVTYRLRKSTNKGGTWADLSPSVTCSYTNGTTTCTDSSNLGVIAAGDWIQPTVQWSVSNGLGYYGGMRFKCRYN